MPVSAFLPIASCRAKFHRRLSQLAGKVCPVSRADPSEAGQVELDDHHGEGSLNVISSFLQFLGIVLGSKNGAKSGTTLKERCKT